ncbi:hypothetical protein [Paenibacillus sp. SI92]
MNTITFFKSKFSFMLILAVILCVAANVIAVVLSTSIQTTELANLQLEKKRLEKRLISLAGQQAPKSVSKDELAVISKQIPVQMEYSHMLDEWKQAGQESGVVVTTLQTTERKAYKDPIAPKDGKEQTVTAEKAALPPSLMSETLNLQVTGSYLQLIDFVNRLQKMERLIDVTSWGMNASNDKTPVMTMSLTVFWAPDYKETVPELLPLSAPEPAKRDDPTVQ